MASRINTGAAAHVIQTTVWLVIQEGGSSMEHYSTLYNSEREAARAARGHRKATYRSTEPIAIKCEMRDGEVFVGEAALIDLIEEVRGAEYE